MKFVRHAKSKHNEDYPDRLDIGDPALCLTGEVQAVQLGQKLGELGVRRIVSSPSLRAYSTGEIAIGASGTPIYTDTRMEELDWGPLAGRNKFSLFGGKIDTSGPWKGLDLRPAVGVETALETGLRELQAAEDWGEEDTLFMGSNFALKSLFAVCLGWDREELVNFKIDNCQVYEFDPFNPSNPTSLFLPVAVPQPVAA